jgi:hypothetical protein
MHARQISLSLSLTLWLVIALTLACGGSGDDAFDRQALESAEDLSESLANDLLAFSVAVRDRDVEGISAFTADQVRASELPAAPSDPETIVKWIGWREWNWPESAETVSGEIFVGRLQALLDRFSEIEDARFKVVSATFDPEPVEGLVATVSGHAKIKFFLIARDEAGRREWVKGKAGIEVLREGEGPWRIAAFEIHEMGSKVSEVDLFSEVGFPAGVWAVFPPFGVGRNEGFVAHGAAAADVNGDGLIDLATSGVDQNYLYLNQGDGRFSDVSEQALVKFTPIGSGAVFLDYDNDGDSDLFFAAVGNQILLENRFVPDGEVVFWDVSEQAGVAVDAVGFSALSADVNGDGLGDIYVCSYNRYGTVMPNSWYQATNGTPNLLFVNRGDGTFEEASAAWGVDDGRWSYAAGFVDIDGNGKLDLYVANDFGENALYLNDGQRFVDVADERRIKDPGFGMGVSFGDYDNDGDLDLHITNMSSTAGNRILSMLYPEDHEIRKTLSKQAAGNSLYERRADGTFHEVTDEVGGLSGGWAFGGGFIDFDNDGWEDLYTPNGFVSGKSMKDT